jgi:hypothetical protein
MREKVTPLLPAKGSDVTVSVTVRLPGVFRGCRRRPQRDPQAPTYPGTRAQYCRAVV